MSTSILGGGGGGGGSASLRETLQDNVKQEMGCLHDDGSATFL